MANQLNIIFDDIHGLSVPDGKIAEFVDDTIEQLQLVDINLVIGSEMIMDCFRLRAVQDKISIDDIHIRFNDLEIKITDKGQFAPWPNGFCDTGVKVIQNILKTRIRRMK